MLIRLLKVIEIKKEQPQQKSNCVFVSGLIENNFSKVPLGVITKKTRSAFEGVNTDRAETEQRSKKDRVQILAQPGLICHHVQNCRLTLNKKSAYKEVRPGFITSEKPGRKRTRKFEGDPYYRSLLFATTEAVKGCE